MSAVIDNINRFRGVYEASRRSDSKKLDARISPWFVEQVGGSVIEVLSGEPDPSTYRRSHYYNSVLNTLFEIDRNGTIAKWKPVSEMRSVSFQESSPPSSVFIGPFR